MPTLVKDQSFRIPGGRVGVLLIHGLCGSPTEMRFVANGLARSGYTVHVPQLAGHCGSEEDLRNSTWRDWYASAEKSLEDINKECDQVIVVGLSTGAVIGMLLAASYPGKVSALGLYSPTLWLNGFQVPWYARLFRIVTFKAFANLFDFPAPHKFGIKCPRIRDFLHKALASGQGPAVPVVTPGGAVLERRWLVDAARRVVGSITQPTLIIHPRHDDYAALNNATYLQRSLAGRVELVVLEDSYHLVTVDRQRHIVVDRTLEFVSRAVNGHGVWTRADRPPTAQEALRPVLAAVSA